MRRAALARREDLWVTWDGLLAAARRAGGPLLLLIALSLGASLRLYNINWDLFQHLHPDERAITMRVGELKLPWPPDWGNLLDAQASTLNPRFFAYGSSSFYVLRGVGHLAALLDPRFSTYDYINLVGRVLSALFDLGTVVVVYFLGRQLYGTAVGLLGAIFVAFSVFHIQVSHFYAADTPMSFFVVVALLLAHRAMGRGDLPMAALLGAAIGLALSFKASAAPLLVLALAAPALRLFGPVGGTAEGPRLIFRWPSAAGLNKAALGMLTTLAAAALVFVLAQPYAVLDFSNYIRQVGEQAAMARGTADLPYTRQYAYTAPYLYFWQNLVLWGFGPPLGLAALAGGLFVLARAVLSPSRPDLLLLSWVVPYFLVTGSFHAKFMRYMLPLMPILAIFAAALLVWLGQRASSRRGQVAVGSAMALVVLGAIAWSLAFVGIYTRPHTRVAASEWIYRHIPAGATLAVEHWDDALPLRVPVEGRAHTSGEYKLVTMNLYDADDPSKLGHIAQSLLAADYVILSSNRLYGSIPRLPERYPLTTRYYRLLFGGELGFRLEKTFASYPSLLGWQIRDDAADESFTVYDHPKVLIFKKQKQLAAEELVALLHPSLAEKARPAGMKALLMSPEQQKANAAGGTYAELFPRDGWANRHPLLTWALLIAALGFLALPLCVVLVPRLPDRGYGFAKALGILALGWLHWSAVSYGLALSTRATVALALLALAGVSLLVAWGMRYRLAELGRTQWRALLVGEGVFWAAFFVFLGLRLSNPDLWHPVHGGEKPMDLAYLTAAAKSSVFPPYDPWFAGGYLNYYYFGQVLIGTLVKLTGIVPTVAYNLAVPTLAGLAAAGAFTLAYNLTAWPAAREARPAGAGPFVAGLAAALFVVGIGNLGGALQLVAGLWQVGALPFHSAIPGLEGLSKALVGMWRLLVEGRPLPIPLDWYWPSTRVIKDTINEFPFFTFLYGDLHAHMIALPYTLVALGLALGAILASSAVAADAGGAAAQAGRGLGTNPVAAQVLALAPPRLRTAGVAHAEGLLRLVLTAIALGSLWAINSWDFPTYLLTFVLATLGSWYWGRRRALKALGQLILYLLAVAVLSLAAYYPFHAHFQAFYFGLEPTRDKSDPAGYLVIHGLFLFLLLSLVFLDLASRYGRAWWLRLAKLLLARWERLPKLWKLWGKLVQKSDGRAVLGVYVFGLYLVGLFSLLLVGWVLIAFLLALLPLALSLLLRRPNAAPPGFVALLFIVGLGLGIFADLWNIKGDVGRMNTVFKFYFQVWTMWALAAGVSFGLVVSGWQGRAGGGRARRWWWLACAVLLAAVLAYLPVAASAKARERFNPALPPTLDGAAYMQGAVHWEQNRPLELRYDLAALRWLQDQVAGSPVVLEAQVPIYRWGSRVSIYTGLPTVLGWDWHQKQQRWGYQGQVEARARDVRAMYTETDAQRVMALLRRYQVSYIYVGELERAYYPPEGLAKFDAMVGRYLELAYANERVKIYRVRGD